MIRLLLVAALVSVFFPRPAPAADIPPLLFNCDGNSCTIGNFEPPMTVAQLCRPVNEIGKTRVGAFLHCVNLGGDAFNYPTEVGDVFGQEVTDWQNYHPRMAMQAANLKSLLGRGIDPLKVTSECVKKNGMQFWISLRMNEEHEDDVKRFGVKVSRFKKANPHLLIGDAYPRGQMAYAEIYNHSSTWNYAHPEVRQHFLKLVDELFSRYEIDGLELDFGRGPCYFKRGEEAKNSPLMAELIAEIRKRIDVYGQSRQKEVILAARVPNSIAQCQRLGLDVLKWIEEENLDLVAVMDNGFLNSQIDLSDFVKAASQTKVKIYGGIEPVSSQYGHMTRAHAFAVLSVMDFFGAQGVYLFNYDCHRIEGRAGEYTADELKLLTDLATLSRHKFEDKHYFIARDYRSWTKSQGGAEQLPAEVQSQSPAELSLVIGDDLEAARRARRVKNAILQVTLKETDVQPNEITLKCNSESVPLKPRPETPGVWIAENPPVKQGRNVLAVEVTPVGGRESLRLDKVELMIDYR